MTGTGLVHAVAKGDKRLIRGWIIYDWANSVYQLTIASTIFPIYYIAVTGGNDSHVSFFGIDVVNTVLYSLTIAVAYLIVAALSPLVSSVADFTGRRKAFMVFFTWMGALFCGMLFFFTPATIEFGIIAFGLATIGYGGSIVFYNSFLPVIADSGDQDRISARGYAMGYLGGVVLLLFNLLMILKPGYFGISHDSSLPARISFFTVFLWWIGFAQITFRRLPKYAYGKGEQVSNILTNGYKELRLVFGIVRKSFPLSVYLTGFFFMMMGVLTVMFMAASYGTKEVGVKEEILIPTILLIQLVGMFGAWLFARISGKIGNFRALIISMIAWIAVCIGAYFIRNALEFMIAAFFIGLVMGGSQSLARSTYSKLLPETTDHTSFFSFFDVMEKLSTVFGLFSFGIIEAITGSMRTAVPVICLFFIIGLFFFFLLRNRFLKSGEKSPSL